MLERLEVRDFALIESAELEFPSGFILFTGETGAGKSLAVGAIGFLLGAKADVSSIRDGAEECIVSGILRVEGNIHALRWLSEHDLPFEEGRVSIRRGMRSNGRSYAYLQNQSVSRTDLAAFTSSVIDIHGQHEHQGLMDEASHLGLIDVFADLEEERKVYQEVYARWIELVREYRKRSSEAEERQKQRDYLEFTIKEIQASKPVQGEDEALSREEKILSQHEKLFESVHGALQFLTSPHAGQDGIGALGLLKRSAADLKSAQDIDPSLSELQARLESGFLELDDIAQSLGLYVEKLRFDPARLQEIESRMAELRRLKKKYGPSLDDVIERERRDKAILDSFESWDDEKAILERDIGHYKSLALQKAETLSSKRKAAADLFQHHTEAILTRLGMAQARLPLTVERKTTEQGRLMLGPAGLDEVRILFAPNPGESPRPLSKIASGGELSRVALAIKSVLSAKDSVDSLIFDEIDVGIGGEVAVAVGDYLRGLARHKQVFCVTHLASIAAKAETHFKVEKVTRAGRTATIFERISGRPREEEIARMLSGDKRGELSLAHAAQLLDANAPQVS